jgi:hypothetical protein
MVSGLVSREQGNARVSVPHGAYSMREIAPARYELSRPGGPTFELGLSEVIRYTRDGGEMRIEPHFTQRGFSAQPYLAPLNEEQRVADITSPALPGGYRIMSITLKE